MMIGRNCNEALFRLTLRETDRHGSRTIIETQTTIGATDAQ